MNHKQAANILLNAWFERISTFDATDEKIFVGLCNVKDVFEHIGHYVDSRSALIELVSAMMQPSSERLYLKSHHKHVHKDKRITYQLTHGMGLKIKNKKQIEIYQLLEDPEFNPSRFGKYMATLLSAKVLEYNKKRKMQKKQLAVFS